MKQRLFILSVLAVVLCLPHEAPAKPTSKEVKCGYEACHATDPNALNVHLVAHSHDDVGWLKTVDQYYYGNNRSIQHAAVQYIIDSVVIALRENPERKFIQVESAFLWKWWREQTPAKRQEFLDLLKSGQLEIVGGAWSMNDEAAVHYHSTIDQFTFGLDYVKSILGECGRPTIGWQIDPFGHTSEMASIFTQMGYEAVFFARLDWRDKSERLKTKTAEMLWRGSASLGKSSLLFTHALYNHYSPPPGFFFDVLSADDPLIPDRQSTEYNLQHKVKDFATFVSKQATQYATNNIIVTMGNDFTYMDAHYSFKNLDILIKGFEEFKPKDSQGRQIKLLYSTPACYLKAVNENATQTDLEFKVKTDDFVPYASDPHTYWSGYFTSRPTQKRFERQGNNLLQVAKQLAASTGTHKEDSLWYLKSAMGIMQHHDAITGTEKQHVARDYARIFFRAVDKAHEEIKDAIPSLLAKKGSRDVGLNFKSCLLANVTHCEESNKDKFVVAVYNPLSRPVSHYVRLPVNSTEFDVAGSEGRAVQHQITPAIANFDYVEGIKPSRFELVFHAQNIPPMGFKLFHVSKLHRPDREILPSATHILGDEGDNIRLYLNEKSNFTHSVEINGLHIPLRQELMYYIGAQGNNMVFKNRSSGAYIFRPDPKHPVAQPFADSLLYSRIYQGPLVDEAHQVFNDWNRQIIRVYKEENHVEFDWLVGPINISDGKAREVISRFQTNLGGHFYTDSNGRELIKRKNDFRATWNYTNEEPVAGNYYPVTAAITIKDTQKAVELGVVTDRAQAGASLEFGQIELMVHRRCLKDDAFGVGEALNETEFGARGMVARGQHYLTFGNSIPSSDDYARRKLRDIAQRKTLAPWVFVADATSHTYDTLHDNINFEYSILTRSLPKEVNVLTLERFGSDKLLLRLENIMEAQDGVGDITVSLKDLFNGFGLASLEEVSLAADRPVDSTKLKWNIGSCLPGLEDDCDLEGARRPHKDDLSDFEVTLSPMEIRTFIAKTK